MNIVVVLGCGRGLSKDEKGYKITKKSHLYYRLVQGLKIFKNIDIPKKLLLSGGGIGEANLMANWLITNDHNITYNDLILETYSRNTIQNAMFTYYTLYQKYKGQVDNINIYLVTNSYHIQRSFLIFNFFKERIENYDGSIKWNISNHEAPIDNNKILGKSWEIETKILSQLHHQLKRWNDWQPIRCSV